MKIFHNASLRLTGLYLLIIMFISLFFSVAVYQLSEQEFNRGILKPGQAIGRPGQNIPTSLLEELRSEREQRFTEAKERVLMRLLIINLLILVAGGGLSYYLARRTLKPIEEAHDSLERFTADASHELRTPLAAMQSETEVALMSKKLPISSARKVLQSNLEEIERLGSLTSSLLRLAHSNNSAIELDRVNLKAVIDRAIKQNKAHGIPGSVAVVADINPKVYVFGDEDSLVELMVILMDNAVKYSPPTAQVIVSAETTNKHVSITVADKGEGIKASELPRIFDRFYRADSARTKQNVGGYGLGLAIAKRIVEVHDGEITAKSLVGSGTSIKIVLPKE